MSPVADGCFVSQAAEAVVPADLPAVPAEFAQRRWAAAVLPVAEAVLETAVEPVAGAVEFAAGLDPDFEAADLGSAADPAGQALRRLGRVPASQHKLRETSIRL